MGQFHLIGLVDLTPISADMLSWASPLFSKL